MTRPTPSHDRGGSDLLKGTGVAVLIALCCAAPVLIAGGALAGVGGLLRSTWLIGAGGLFVVAAILLGTARRHRDGEDDD